MTSGFRGLYRSVLFRSKCFEIFLLSLCYRFLVWFNCGQRTQFVWFQFCFSCWDLFYGLTYLSWCMFCEHLRRMYYMLYCFLWHVLLLSVRSCWLMVLFESSISLLIFCMVFASDVELRCGGLQMHSWIYLFLLSFLSVFTSHIPVVLCIHC